MSSDDRTRPDESISRRSVLGAVGSGVAFAAVPTLSEPVSAEKRRAIREVQSQYADVSRAERALAAEAADLLEVLSDRGIIPEPSTAAFPTDGTLSKGAFADGEEGLYVGTVGADGEVSAHLVATARTDDHEVTVVAQPERGHSYARVVPDDGEAFKIDADRGEVTPEGYCWWETRCEYDQCGTQLGTCYEYECCEQGGVTDCDPWGPTGDCCGQKTNC